MIAMQAQYLMGHPLVEKPEQEGLEDIEQLLAAAQITCFDSPAVWPAVNI